MLLTVVVGLCAFLDVHGAMRLVIAKSLKEAQLPCWQGLGFRGCHDLSRVQPPSRARQTLKPQPPNPAGSQ